MVHTASAVLLLKRKDHQHFWQSVTGALEWGESASHAAARELVEETAITQGSMRSTGVSRTYAILEAWRDRYPPNTKKNKEHLFFYELSRELQIELNQGEHSDFQWLKFETALDQVYSWTNRLAIESLM